MGFFCFGGDSAAGGEGGGVRRVEEATREKSHESIAAGCCCCGGCLGLNLLPNGIASRGATALWNDNVCRWDPKLLGESPHRRRHVHCSHRRTLLIGYFPHGISSPTGNSIAVATYAVKHCWGEGVGEKRGDFKGFFYRVSEKSFRWGGEDGASDEGGEERFSEKPTHIVLSRGHRSAVVPVGGHRKSEVIHQLTAVEDNINAIVIVFVVVVALFTSPLWLS